MEIKKAMIAEFNLLLISASINQNINESKRKELNSG